MSRVGDESDEEVYLSDPSDDEESKSVEDYEYANDHKGAIAYEEELPGLGSQHEIDYTLHDAEADRAKGKEDEAPVTPRTREEQKKTTLSPNAAPWVPPTQKPPANAVGQAGSHSAADEDTAEDRIAPMNSTEFPPLADAVGVSGKGDSKGSTVPSSPAQTMNHQEVPGSPIDVSGMLQRAAAAHNQPKSTGTAKNGAKEHPSDTFAANPMGDAPAHTTSYAAAAAMPPPSKPEGKPESKPESKPSERTSGKPETPAAVLHGSQEAAETAPEASLPAADTAVAAGKSEEEGTRDTEPFHLTSHATAATETVTPASKSEAEEKSHEIPTPSVPPSSTRQPEEALDKAEESKASVSAAPPPSNGQSGTSAAPAETPNRPSAMPTLPERKRPGSAMPSLPARPQRRSAVPASTAGGDGEEESSRQPAAKQDEEERHAPPPPSQPADKPATQPTPPANGQGDRPPPANGQRGGPITLQRVNNSTAQEQQAPREPESDSIRKLREDLRELRVLLLRIASRLNYSSHGVVQHVQYRLDLAERVRVGRDVPSEDLAKIAKQREEADPEAILYDATVMVIGPAGTGKSATINSLLGREAVLESAFEEGTRKVVDASGEVYGLKLRMIDTPGLETAAGSTRYNSRVLSQIDSARKKYKPDLILYCERLDMLRRDLSDIPLIRQITETLGSEVWFNTILTLTHATAQGPLGPNGQHLPFDAISQTRAAMLQRSIQAAVGDARISAPACYVENSPSCPRNADGDAVLPNGVAWRRFALMCIMSMRVLREADSLMEVAPRENQQLSQQQRLMQQLFQQPRSQKLPPLPYLVPNMIRHAGPKQLPDVERDIKSEAEIRTIKDPYERRQQFRKRTEYLKSRQAERRVMALPSNQEEEIETNEEPSPGPALGPSFDSDENSHYYRSYEPKPGEPGWITRPRLDQNCFDHTDGVESLTTERSFVLRPKLQELGGIPAQMHAIIQKDKSTTLVQADAEASFYQSWKLIHTGRAQVLTLAGGDILYVSQLETQIIRPAFSRLTLGGMVSRLGEEGSPPTKGLVAMGLKIEEEVDLPEIPKYNAKHGFKAGLARAQVKLPGGRKEMATGANAEWQLTGGKRENVQILASASQMAYRGNPGRQYALSAAVPVTADTVVAPKIQMQSSGQGNLYLRVTSHDHPLMGLVVLLPLGKALWDKIQRKDADLV